MTDERSFLETPQGTQEEIMNATYHALCEHGYADLTIQRIGDQFEKSKSLLYHHYDGKDELLYDFLDFMLEELERTVPDTVDEDAETHLTAIFDKIFDNCSDQGREFEAAMVELRAQAAHDDRYQEYITQHDQFFKNRLTHVIEVGIADGDFRDVDPDRVSSFLLTVFGGARTHRATSAMNVARPVRDELEAYVESVLLTENAEG